MFSRIAGIAKGSFSRYPRRFCSRATNNGNSSIVSQVPLNLEYSIGGVSLPWIAYTTVFTTGMVYLWIHLDEQDKKLEMRDKQLKKMRKEVQEFTKVVERQHRQNKEVMRKHKVLDKWDM